MGRTIRHILISVILKLPVEKECFVLGWPPAHPLFPISETMALASRKGSLASTMGRPTTM